MMRSAAGRTQPANLDDLPGDGKAAILAEPPQTLHDCLVLDFLGGPAIVADHKLAFVRVLDVVTGDKSAGALDLMDQLVGKQKIERAIDCWRTKLAALALQFCKHRIGADRLIGSKDQFKHPPSHRRQSRTPRCAELFRASQPPLDVLRFQRNRFLPRVGVIFACKVSARAALSNRAIVDKPDRST